MRSGWLGNIDVVLVPNKSAHLYLLTRADGERWVYLNENDRRRVGDDVADVKLRP